MVKKKDTKGLTIRRKELNNKSRKGWYYYIKEGKKRPAYYKIKEGVTIDNYLMAYTGKVKIKKKGVMQYTKETPAEKYLKTVVKDKRKIDKLISKGITETSVTNLQLLDRSRSHAVYQKMLRPLVKDKELLHILALEENVRKFKHRIQTQVVLSSGDGKISINLKAFNKTLGDINTDLIGIKKGSMNEEDLQNILKKGYKLDGVPRGVDITGSRYHIIANTIKSIKVNVKFVKAK